MIPFHDVLSACLAENERLRKNLSKAAGPQIRDSEARSLAKATALAWFNSHRTIIASTVAESDLKLSDDAFTTLLNYADKNTTKIKYMALIKSLKRAITEIRTNYAARAAEIKTEWIESSKAATQSH